MGKNLTKIKIIGHINNGIPTPTVLEKLCLMRTARTIGDIETVNNTQLGRLNQHGILYIKLP